MRCLAVAVVTAVLLALAGLPAQASSTLLPPLGKYAGTTSTDKPVHFTLKHDSGIYYFVVDLQVGPVGMFRTTRFHYGPDTYGYFTYSVADWHFWGAWTAQYGHMKGGYSHPGHDGRTIVHFTAKAEGF